MGSYFSFDGRLNRLKYFLILLIVNVVAYAIYFILGILLGTSGSETGATMATASGMVGFIVGILAAVVCAFAVVKRLHDIERPGAHFWLLLIPIYNIILALILLFKKGTAGKNKFGKDPLA